MLHSPPARPIPQRWASAHLLIGTGFHPPPVRLPAENNRDSRPRYRSGAAIVRVCREARRAVFHNGPDCCRYDSTAPLAAEPPQRILPGAPEGHGREKIVPSVSWLVSIACPIRVSRQFPPGSSFLACW